MLLNLTTRVPPGSPLLRQGAVERSLVSTGHVGTHLDTYRKKPIPLEYFRCPGVLFDVSGTEEAGLTQGELSRIPKSAFVLFHTGHIQHYPYGDSRYFSPHPFLSQPLLQALVDLDIRFIGVDCPGIRPGREHRPADELCEERGIYVIENLCNLQHLKAPGAFQVYTMWLEDPEQTGLPCRVIAEW